MSAYERLYAAAFYEYQQKELKVLRQRIADGMSIKELLSTGASDLWQFRRQLRGKLLDVMTRVRVFGQQQIGQELERQRT